MDRREEELMERVSKRKLSIGGDSSDNGSGNGSDNGGDCSSSGNASDGITDGSLSCAEEEIDFDNLPWDPAERKQMSEYHPSQRDEIRRRYLVRGPCQPRGHSFPCKWVGEESTGFNPVWFDLYGSWLEYSVKEDKAFCLCCYLFGDELEDDRGVTMFVVQGFRSWNRTDSFVKHVGDVDSFHNWAVRKCVVLLAQDQFVVVAFRNESDAMKNEDHVRLKASVDVSRFLLGQGITYGNDDESEHEDNFFELIKFTANQNEAVGKAVLGDVLGNYQMTTPSAQKDIAHCFAQEVLKSILEDVADNVFSLLVHESSDVSNAQQVIVFLRYVDLRGIVRERFIGIVHVKEISSLSFKLAVDSLFSQLGLSWKKVRGQAYDGVSDMRSEFNGLKSLITRQCTSAYYVHWFAQRLHLVIVAVVKDHLDVGNFFDMISLLLGVIGGSCTMEDMDRECHRQKVIEAFGLGEISTERGLDQELDSSYGSHYTTLISVLLNFESIMIVLEHVADDGTDQSKRSRAIVLLKYFQTFDFMFYLHLMLDILGIMHTSSSALQRRDQHIANAMSVVRTTESYLETIVHEGWDSLLKKISAFCEKLNKIPAFEEFEFTMVNMEEFYIDPRKPRASKKVTNLHHYLYDCFHKVYNMVRTELSDRFDEGNSELLNCIHSLSPLDSFREFESSNLMRLAELYQDDYGLSERKELKYQLDVYISFVRVEERFANLKGLADLARVMVETRVHLYFPLVFRLLKLALTLPIATTTFERCVSAMKIVKTNLHCRMADQF